MLAQRQGNLYEVEAYKLEITDQLQKNACRASLPRTKPQRFIMLTSWLDSIYVVALYYTIMSWRRQNT
jgi:hypothetical protein